MDDVKTVVRSVRYTPETWAKIKTKAHELGITTGKLIEMATRSMLGEPVSEKYKAVGQAFER